MENTLILLHLRKIRGILNIAKKQKPYSKPREKSLNSDLKSGSYLDKYSDSKKTSIPHTPVQNDTANEEAMEF